MKLLISRLHTAKFTDVHIVTQLSNDTPKNSYDIVISTPSTRMLSVVDDAKIFDILVAGGQVFQRFNSKSFKLLMFWPFIVDDFYRNS